MTADEQGLRLHAPEAVPPGTSQSISWPEDPPWRELFARLERLERQQAAMLQALMDIIDQLQAGGSTEVPEVLSLPAGLEDLLEQPPDVDLKAESSEHPTVEAAGELIHGDRPEAPRSQPEVPADTDRPYELPLMPEVVQADDERGRSVLEAEFGIIFTPEIDQGDSMPASSASSGSSEEDPILEALLRVSETSGSQPEGSAALPGAKDMPGSAAQLEPRQIEPPDPDPLDLSELPPPVVEVNLNELPPPVARVDLSELPPPVVPLDLSELPPPVVRVDLSEAVSNTGVDEPYLSFAPPRLDFGTDLLDEKEPQVSADLSDLPLPTPRFEALFDLQPAASEETEAPLGPSAIHRRSPWTIDRGAFDLSQLPPPEPGPQAPSLWSQADQPEHSADPDDPPEPAPPAPITPDFFAKASHSRRRKG
ncbi:MAG: hypothetical protein M1115_05580 [Actinobacteria bacterium]|nr:hypothetical protein [Actinomycetota bacterium]